ncbi:histidinol phosphatase [Flavobacteriaceae bacterium]|nr:histidinol phosphatase [Flavobacteriaceae bacterium]
MDFSFFIKKKEFIDFHNHLLAGIDDGSKSLDESLDMLKLYADLGINKVIVTPHIYKDLYPNNKKCIQTAFTKLNKASKDNEVELLSFAAEYLVDEFFMADLNSKKPLLKCFGNYILIEIPFFDQLNRLNEALFSLQNQGYYPILAHPERYAVLQRTEAVEDLKQRGAKMQLNALSLMGYYGLEVQKKASLWLSKGLFDFIGTDAHNLHQLYKLKSIRLNKKEHLAWDKICKSQVELISKFY